MTNRQRRSAVLVVALLAAVGLVAWLLLRERVDGAPTAVTGGAAVRAPAEERAAQLPGSPAFEADVAPLVARDGAEAAAPDTSAMARLVVRVVWASDGSAAADVGVHTVFWALPDPLFAVRDGLTDAAGHWEVADAPPGPATVYLDRANGDTVTLRAGATTELALEVPAGLFVRGLVVDEDERPVAGGGVWVQEGSAGQGFVVARSGPDGRFTLRDMDEHRLIGAQADGHVPSPLVRVRDDGTHACDMTLRLGAAGAHLAGRVVDGDGAPVPGAVVLVGPENGWTVPLSANILLVSGQPPRRVTTDAAGAFAVRDVPPGSTPVAARSHGHSLWRGMATLIAGDNEALEIVLPESAWVSGVVTDPEGKPAAGATIHVETWGEMDRVETSSGPDGTYVLRDLPMGSPVLAARIKDIGEDGTTLVVGAGSRLQWNPRLIVGPQIVGRVVDGSGAPVVGLHVDGQAIAYGRTTFVQADTDQQGRFVLSHCADAEHELTVRTPDWQTVVGGRHGVRPGPDEVVVQLAADTQRSAFFIGRVLDAHGQVPELAAVLASDPDTGLGESQPIRADSGEFRLGPLVPGRWDVYVMVAGQIGRSAGRFTLAADETRDLGTIALPEAGRLIVQIALPEGADPGGVRCVAMSVDAGRTGDWLKPMDGEPSTWVSDRLGAGDYQVGVFGSPDRGASVHILPQHLTVHLEGGKDTRLQVTAERGVAQSLVLSTGRDDAPETSVVLRGADGSEALDSSVRWYDPDGDGRKDHGYAFFVGRPGAYTLEVTSQGKVVEQRSVQLPAGANIAPEIFVRVP